MAAPAAKRARLCAGVGGAAAPAASEDPRQAVAPAKWSRRLPQGGAAAVAFMVDLVADSADGDDGVATLDAVAPAATEDKSNMETSESPSESSVDQDRNVESNRTIVEEKSRTRQQTDAKVQALEAAPKEKESKVVKLEKEFRTNMEEKSRMQQKTEAKVQALEAALAESLSKLVRLERELRTNVEEKSRIQQQTEAKVQALEAALAESLSKLVTLEKELRTNVEEKSRIQQQTEAEVQAIVAALAEKESKLVTLEKELRTNEKAKVQAKEQKRRTRQKTEAKVQALEAALKESKEVKLTQEKSRTKQQTEAKVQALKAALAEKASKVVKFEEELRANVEEKSRTQQHTEAKVQAFEAALAVERSKVADLENPLKGLRFGTLLTEERKDLEASDRLCKLSAMWKNPLPGIALLDILPKSNMVSAVLRELSHREALWQGGPSACHKFQGITIRHVQSVHNPDLWQQYKMCKTRLRETHTALGVSLQPLKPNFHGLDALLSPELHLDKSVNEAILVHGCDAQAAQAIVETGWDIRFTRTRSLYGEGVYFSSQPCKCNQYTSVSGPKHLMIGRVALGDPAYLRGEHTGRLPPYRNPADPQKGRFDSIIIDPQHSTRGQAHWEYVVFEGKQAYPEMLVTYELN